MFRRLLYFLRRSRYEADLREEIETHRALRQAALERDGVSPDDARWMSRRAMGNVTLAVEDVRDVWIVRAIDQVWQDVQFAFRGLRKNPGFAFAAVCTFALGLGANTAIFTVVHAALLKPLPYADPDDLVAVSAYVPQLQARFPSLAIRALDFEEYRRENRVFSEMAAIRDRNFNLIAPATIVGVVGDVRAAALERDPTPAIYVPHTRNRSRAMTVVIRTHQDPEALAAVVRAQIWKRDNSVPIERMRTMREIMSESVAPRRFQTTLVLLFALLALGLALVGVYGVTSYAVARQTREIGVRFALGAPQSDLLRSVLAQGMRPVAAGLLFGTALAWAMTTAMRSFLFGVAPLDPVALVTVSVVLIATAAMACYVPARRAARMDPLVALRHD
jgi:hypothetical protein